MVFRAFLYWKDLPSAAGNETDESSETESDQ